MRCRQAAATLPSSARSMQRVCSGAMCQRVMETQLSRTRGAVCVCAATLGVEPTAFPLLSARAEWRARDRSSAPMLPSVVL